MAVPSFNSPISAGQDRSVSARSSTPGRCRELDAATFFPAALTDPDLKPRRAPRVSPPGSLPPAPTFLPQLTPGSARRETTGGGRGRRLFSGRRTQGEGNSS